MDHHITFQKFLPWTIKTFHGLRWQQFLCLLKFLFCPARFTEICLVKSTYIKLCTVNSDTSVWISFQTLVFAHHNRCQFFWCSSSMSFIWRLSYVYRISEATTHWSFVLFDIKDGQESPAEFTCTQQNIFKSLVLDKSFSY